MSNTEHYFSRREALRLAGLSAGALLLGGCGGDDAPAAAGARPPIEQEPKALSVIEWDGWDTRKANPTFFDALPGTNVKFLPLDSDAGAFGKVAGGQRADLVHPDMRYGGLYEKLGAFEPFDPKLIPNLANVDPGLLKAAQINGKQYGIPTDRYQFSMVYRTDKIDDPADSWNLVFDDKYAGRLAWADTSTMVVIACLALGKPDPTKLTEDDLAQAKDFLVKKKKNVRRVIASFSDIGNSVASGDIWAAPTVTDPLDALAKSDVPFAFAKPREGRLVGADNYLLFKGSKSYRQAHAYVDGWLAQPTVDFLAAEFSVPSTNVKAKPAKPFPTVIAEAISEGDTSSDVKKIFISNYPLQLKINSIWEQVKAA